MPDVDDFARFGPVEEVCNVRKFLILLVGGELLFVVLVIEDLFFVLKVGSIEGLERDPGPQIGFLHNFLELIKIIITITLHPPFKPNFFSRILQALSHLIKEIIYYNKME